MQQSRKSLKDSRYVTIHLCHGSLNRKITRSDEASWMRCDTEAIKNSKSTWPELYYKFVIWLYIDDWQHSYIFSVINIPGSMKFSKRGAFTGGETVSTKIIKKCKFWRKILNKVLAFDRSSHQIYCCGCKSWLINLLVILICCDFLSFYQQFGFKKWGAFIRKGVFITNNTVYPLVEDLLLGLNPCLPKVFFVMPLLKGGWLQPPP